MSRTEELKMLGFYHTNIVGASTYAFLDIEDEDDRNDFRPTIAWYHN